MAEISVVVPIYNAEKYLRECIDSIINQTFKDLEIICINDGSTDGTLNILEEYQNNDSRIKIINKENTGYGDTLNKGIEAATSKYIGIIESDDFIGKPEMYKDLYDIAEKHDAEIVRTDHFYYWTETKDVQIDGRIGRFFKTDSVVNVETVPDLVHLMPALWASLYKRDFLIDNNIKCLPREGASFQDTSFFFKSIVLAKRVVLSDKAYVYYRKDNVASSCNGDGNIYCIADEWAEIHRFLNEHKDLKNMVSDLLYNCQIEAYKWNLERINFKYKQDFMKRMEEDFRKYY